MSGSGYEAPDVGFSRLLVISTGSLSAAFLPYWANWLRASAPQLGTRYVVTGSAERFVTRASLAAASGAEVALDAWPESPEASARHVELAEWAEAILVYPATLHFLARLALGLADSPALLAAQCSACPTVVAPSLPPGGTESPAYQSHVAALSTRRNTVVCPPHRGRSVSTGRVDAWMPAHFPDLLSVLEQRRHALLEPSARPVSDAVALSRPTAR